jgi:hypothetical protein
MTEYNHDIGGAMTEDYGHHERDERRTRSLTDADIEAIAAAVIRLQPHSCRFIEISREDLEASVRFHRTVNELMSETGSTIRKTLIVAGIGGLISLLVIGLYAKIRHEMGLQ